MNLETIIDKIREIILRDFETEAATLFTDGGEPELDPVVDESIVAFDFDIDKNKRGLMLFLLPEAEQVERITIEGEESTQGVSVYIICRNDTPANLYKKVLRYSRAFRDMIRGNNTLDGIAGDSYVTNAEYFHAVEGNPAIKGAELQITVEVDD
ncbi:hypothetical protein [Spirochaeta africana]|uniref:Uncharacterized protein n=1 Tax=Spirochaeta africana (strain ATCC 700263 / DSM 8902 / Z-7692) TaxID=889378 RepID=H9UJD8_SPIAZ|nr:hypothetical protein [Spirochaeta africana]AFG37631.1 hypothetical protein Spiaf_1572 [Spirochaeta africana DSM 8902]